MKNLFTGKDYMDDMDYERGAAKAVTWLAMIALVLAAAGILTGCAMLDSVASDERVQAEFERAVAD